MRLVPRLKADCTNRYSSIRYLCPRTLCTSTDPPANYCNSAFCVLYFQVHCRVPAPELLFSDCSPRSSSHLILVLLFLFSPFTLSLLSTIRPLNQPFSLSNCLTLSSSPRTFSVISAAVLSNACSRTFFLTLNLAEASVLRRRLSSSTAA